MIKELLIKMGAKVMYESNTMIKLKMSDFILSAMAHKRGRKRWERYTLQNLITGKIIETNKVDKIKSILGDNSKKNDLGIVEKYYDFSTIHTKESLEAKKEREKEVLDEVNG